jgi:hypothetical protein
MTWFSSVNVPLYTGPGAAETGASSQTSRKRGAQDVDEDTGKHKYAMVLSVADLGGTD